jgi:hypothetical protein
VQDLAAPSSPKMKDATGGDEAAAGEGGSAARVAAARCVASS